MGLSVGGGAVAARLFSIGGWAVRGGISGDRGDAVVERLSGGG